MAQLICQHLCAANLVHPDLSSPQREFVVGLVFPVMKTRCTIIFYLFFVLCNVKGFVGFTITLLKLVNIVAFQELSKVKVDRFILQFSRIGQIG